MRETAGAVLRLAFRNVWRDIKLTRNKALAIQVIFMPLDVFTVEV
jgi:hypothetical protein